MKLKFFDIPAVAIAIAVAATSAVMVYALQSGEAQVVIEAEGRTWTYPLDATETVHIPGKLGDSVVQIKDGKVSITSSPCPNQTCVAAGSISSGGQWVACLPNEVFVRIEGKTSDQAPDVTVR